MCLQYFRPYSFMRLLFPLYILFFLLCLLSLFVDKKTAFASCFFILIFLIIFVLVLSCGVSWTKFEHCTNKIRRILINFARAERVVILSQIVRSDFVVMLTTRASHSFQSRTKTKNFLTFPFKTAGGVQGGPQKIERKFYGFVFVASLRKSRAYK